LNLSKLKRCQKAKEVILGMDQVEINKKMNNGRLI
jgi:hypothetical protein